MMQQDILRQVLQAKGLNPEEVLAEVARRQEIVGILTEVGKRVGKIVGGFGLVDIKVKVDEDGKVTVWWDDGNLTEKVELTLTQNDDDGKDGKRRKDAKGPEIADKLAKAAKAYGIELKEWQVRSIAFHFPQIVKSLIKETKNGILQNQDFRDAVKMYAEWHPERKAELPQDALTQNANNAENADNADNANNA
jgi:hypothetical protein